MAHKSNPSSRSRNGSPMRPAFGSPSYTPDDLSVADDLHPVIHAGRVALITGAASGIGRAAAIEFAKWVFVILDVVILFCPISLYFSILI